MSTTTVFVELLIIGLQALAWLTLLVGSTFGLGWVSYIASAFEAASVFTTIATIGVAYVVGIVVDEICDSLIEPWARCIRSSVREEGEPPMWDMQACVFAHSEVATSQLEYMRSRLRILRASIFNAFLNAVFALVFLWIRAPVSLASRGSLTLFIGIRLSANHALVLVENTRSLPLAQRVNQPHCPPCVFPQLVL
jgi:hypothetical protein